LRSSKPELRADLLAQGALARPLAETAALAEAMAADLAARVAKSRGLDEAAKVADPAAWAAKMAEAAAAAR
ncbi:TnpV protein, partial [Alistipes onderdonkii]|nr:TnpV protein [Alistipes onderdonkii]